MIRLIISGLISFVVTGFLSWFLFSARFKKILVDAKLLFKKIKKDSENEVEKIEFQGKEAVTQIKLDYQKHIEKEKNYWDEEIHEFEIRLEKEQQKIDIEKEENVEIQKRIDLLFDSINENYNKIRDLKNEKFKTIKSIVPELETKAETTSKQLKENIVNNLIEKIHVESNVSIHNAEEIPESDFISKAKRIIGISIGRVGHTKLQEKPQIISSIPLQLYNKLISFVDNPEELNEIFDIKLVFTKFDNMVSIKFDSLDSVKREIIRRVLEKFPNYIKNKNDLIKFYNKKLDEMNNELTGYGRKAFKSVGLKPKAHKEIIKLLGRLYYRTSYTQNQWLHVVEAAQLAGLMALELNLDVEIAKRATLLHDIGKSLTHILEGSHAVIGMEKAKEYGEEEIIVNAIGAHHGDVPPKSLYSKIVMAADAMSGGRPGARKELVATYFDRIRELERVALDFKGVKEVFAVQAGRELRIHVDKDIVSDDSTNSLAVDISKKISDKLNFPGHIKVTVIRKFNAVEYAR
jgi:ribonucrease Y